MNKRVCISGVVVALCVLILTLSQCINATTPGAEDKNPRAAYAGPAACGSCHAGVSNSYAHTAHNHSSAPASPETVRGSFERSGNEYFYRPAVKVVMEKKESGLYQTAYMDGMAKQSNRFDIVMGSGRKAQTYLYWLDENAYQLPVSYSVPAKSWVNSPGYPPHQVRFDRNVPVGCFECHSSYIRVTSNTVAGTSIIDNFDRNSVQYGIGCERCHGPAAQHVSYHRQHPQQKAPQFITRYQSLTRQQKTAVCASCHSGIQEPLKSIFDFRPGDTLVGNYFAPPAPVNAADLDVHGNQTQLLAASACFIKDNTLTCSSCHNAHVTERENAALFSSRCISCHASTTHNFGRVPALPAAAISLNCIDCHMPAQPSKVITLLSNGQASPTPNLVRTHLIKVYPEETKKYFSAQKNR